MSPLWWKYFKAGFPTCCEAHARNSWMVIWDIGDDFDFSIKLGLS